MTKDDPITSALVDKFFDPVINAESEEALRDWVRQQTTEEIERFLNIWNWVNFPDRETILRQELERRSKAEMDDKGGERDKDAGQLPQSRAREPEVLEPKPPEILQKLQWLKRYGWKYKWHVLAAALVLLSGTILMNFSSVLFSGGSDVAPERRQVSAQATPAIEITEIELLSAEKGSFPHDDELLYTLAIHGTYTLTAERDQYTMIVFYKDLAKADQRIGWFVIEKLDERGSAQPNSVPLDEMAPDGWIFHTSRLYLPSETKPLIAVRAVLLPLDTLEELRREIVYEELGWGKESLSFITGLQGVVASDRAVFSNAKSN